MTQGSLPTDNPPGEKSSTDGLVSWLSKHYLAIINTLLALYVGFALMAPVLMKLGLEQPADLIYRVYRPLCHQLTYRSFFLFGEQAAYPRELAGVESLVTYEEITDTTGENLLEASTFSGNDQMGYKAALCQRDLAIYGSLLAFGLIFAFSKRGIKPIPWLVWILVGLGPIGLDGFSQMLSQMNLPMFDWLPLRESTPMLRVLTGTLFGVVTGWFGFPSLEDALRPAQAKTLMRNASPITEEKLK